jgi:hypothetical protein
VVGIPTVDLEEIGLAYKEVGPADGAFYTPGPSLSGAELDGIRDAMAADWAPGKHHDQALALAGYLVAYRVPEMDCWRIIQALLAEHGGNKADCRRAVRDSYRKASEGISVAGWARLNDRDDPLIGRATAGRLDLLLRRRRPEFSWFSETPSADDPEAALPPEVRERAQQHPFIIGARQLLEEPDEGDSMLIDGVVRSQVVTWLAGPPRVFKSWIMMALGMALAAGVSALSAFHVHEALPVIYLQEEGSRRDVRRRLRAITRGYEILPAHYDPNFQIVTNARWRLDRDDHVERLVNEGVMPHRPALVMLDPYRNLHHTDENSADQQMRMMERLLMIRDLFGCSFLICHHFGKEDIDGRKRREGEELRGSSVLWAAAAGGLLVYPTQKEDTVRLTLLHKEGLGRREVLVRLTFGPDPDDDGGVVRFGVINVGEERFSADAVLETLATLHLTQPGGWPTALQVAEAMGMKERTAADKLAALCEGHLAEARPKWREKTRYAPINLPEQDAGPRQSEFRPDV